MPKLLEEIKNHGFERYYKHFNAVEQNFISGTHKSGALIFVRYRPPETEQLKKQWIDLGFPDEAFREFMEHKVAIERDTNQKYCPRNSVLNATIVNLRAWVAREEENYDYIKECLRAKKIISR